MYATIHIDGAARGNPGPAAYAFVIARTGSPDLEENGRLGSTTNNVAEYTALVRALGRAAELGLTRLEVKSDSELLVKQMNGQYKVKNEGLRPLFEEARALCGRFDLVSIRHVPRGQNKRADQLCNEALDGQGTPPAKSSPAAPRSSSRNRPNPRADAARAAAVECLRAAATCWAAGNPEAPSAEDVWDQLWSIIEENGLVRAPRSREG